MEGDARRFEDTTQWLGELQSRLVSIASDVCSAGYVENIFPLQALVEELETLTVLLLQCDRTHDPNWVPQCALKIGIPHAALMEVYELLYQQWEDRPWSEVRVVRCVSALSFVTLHWAQTADARSVYQTAELRHLSDEMRSGRLPSRVSVWRQRLSEANIEQPTDALLQEMALADKRLGAIQTVCSQFAT